MSIATVIEADGGPESSELRATLEQRLRWLKRHEREFDVWGLVAGYWTQYAVRDLPPELWAEFALRWLTSGVRAGYVGGAQAPPVSEE